MRRKSEPRGRAVISITHSRGTGEEEEEEKKNKNELSPLFHKYLSIRKAKTNKSTGDTGRDDRLFPRARKILISIDRSTNSSGRSLIYDVN